MRPGPPTPARATSAAQMSCLRYPTAYSTCATNGCCPGRQTSMTDPLAMGSAAPGHQNATWASIAFSGRRPRTLTESSNTCTANGRTRSGDPGLGLGGLPPTAEITTRPDCLRQAYVLCGLPRDDPVPVTQDAHAMAAASADSSSASVYSPNGSSAQKWSKPSLKCRRLFPSKMTTRSSDGGGSTSIVSHSTCLTWRRFESMPKRRNPGSRLGRPSCECSVMYCIVSMQAESPVYSLSWLPEKKNDVRSPPNFVLV